MCVCVCVCVCVCLRALSHTTGAAGSTHSEASQSDESDQEAAGGRRVSSASGSGDDNDVSPENLNPKSETLNPEP